MKKIFLPIYRIFFLIVGLSFLFYNLSAQKIDCYPENWWPGMKHNKIQLMLHGTGIGNSDTVIVRRKGVAIQKIHKVEGKNYLFVDIIVSKDAPVGKFNLTAYQKKKQIKIPFELKARRTGNGTSFAQGVSSSDFIYLIMPDRFSDGDTTNDRVKGMRDQSLNRDSVFLRHGGDLKGVQNHLDYLQSLGVTALWLNPVIENDMPNRTEHGYAFTNQYKIDPRLGGESAYHSLIDAAHKRGIKIIQDAVYNHVGSYHFTVLDPPMKDWLHQWPEYTNTTYKEQTIFDPHGSKLERKKMQDGWFVPSMPDLNQENPYVANYLIQHAIWTVEEFGIDAWRIDTYAYNDLNFMNKCNQALVEEYPKIFMFGETYVHGVINQSYFAKNIYDIPFKSNLPGVTDFQTLWAIIDAGTKDFGWTDGINEMYNTLSNDFVYSNPMNNVIFLDNHDLSRYYSIVGTNFEKYKAALVWLFTCRGIPQLYYGDEIGMKGFTYPNDGYVRLDFPGGWKGDPENKFLSSGRTPGEDSIWNLVSTLANFRKNAPAIKTGKMMQFTSSKGEYIYFRYDHNHTIMIALNTAKEPVEINLAEYNELIRGFTKMKDVLTGEIVPLKDFTLKSWESHVWELIP